MTPSGGAETSPEATKTAYFPIVMPLLKKRRRHGRHLRTVIMDRQQANARMIDGQRPVPVAAASSRR